MVAMVPISSGNMFSLANANQALSTLAQQLNQQRVGRQQDERQNLLREQFEFNKGADARAEQKAQRERERIGLLAQEAMGMAKGLQYGGEEEFFAQPEVQKALLSTPEYQNLDKAGQTKARSDFLLKNPGIFMSPQNFGDQLGQTLAASGNYSYEDINKIVDNEVSKRYPSLSPEIGKKLLDTGKGKGTNLNISVPGASGTRGAGGSYAQVSGSPDQMDTQTLYQNFVENYGIPKGGAFEFAGVRWGDYNLLGGKRDITGQDVLQYMSAMKKEGVPEYAALDELGSWLDQDADIDFNIHEIGQAKNKARLAAMKQGAMDRVAAQERVMNRKTGQVGTGGGSAVADALLTHTLRDNYNNQILSRMSPQGATRDEILQQFIGSLGGQYNPDQPLLGNRTAPAPDATPAPVAAPAPAPAAQTTPAPTVQAPAPVLTDQGAPITADNADQVLDQLNTGEPAQADFRDPIDRLLGVAPEGTLNADQISQQQAALQAKMFKQPTGDKLSRTAQQQKLNAMYNISGTGGARKRFERSLNREQRYAYEIAKDPRTPRKIAMQIMTMLDQGLTPNVEITQDQLDAERGLPPAYVPGFDGPLLSQ